MEQNRDNYAFLTEGPIHRVIGTMAVPTIISMLVLSLYMGPSKRSVQRGMGEKAER